MVGRTPIETSRKTVDFIYEQPLTRFKQNTFKCHSTFAWLRKAMLKYCCLLLAFCYYLCFIAISTIKMKFWKIDNFLFGNP